MPLSRLKPLLIRVLGRRAAASLHGLRFAWLRWRGDSPEPELALLDAFLKPGDVAVDVGANGADWTQALSRRTGASGHVYAFEADPYYAIATQQAIRLLRLPSVTLFHFGLSDREENVPLRVKPKRGARFSGRGSVEREGADGDGETVPVHLRPLDDLVTSHPRLLQTALIKCDVEGFELFVFRGATRVLEVARPVVILEIGRSEKQGYTPADLYQFFAARGYRAFGMTGAGRLEETDASLSHPSIVGHNRTMVPKEKLAAIGQMVGIGE